MIPLKINNVNLCKIFTPELSINGWTEDDIQEYSIQHQMFPTEVALVSETYSRDAERTADYELEDLPTGSGGTLVRSIKEKLFVLPDDVKVYPGHGGSTTIGHEKTHNPFIQ